MLVSSPAVVLQVRKYGETSKIVHVYSRAYGRISVIAKGAREMKSKFGGALEAFTHVSLVFYYKKERPGLFLLSKADTIQSNAGILNSLERIQAASELSELLLRTLHDEEENEELFNLLTQTLAGMSSAKSEETVLAFTLYFFLRFIELSGFRFNLNEEIFEGLGTRQSQILFKVRTGDFIEAVQNDGPDDSLGSGLDANLLRVLPESFAILQFLERASIEKVESLRPSFKAYSNLREIFTSFFSEHFDGMRGRSLRSGHSLT
jgi:DNA repair protein RecO